LNGVIQLGLLVLAQSALAKPKIDGRRADQLVVVQVLDGGIQLGSRLLSQSVGGLSLLGGCGGGGIGLGCGGSGLGGLLAGIGGLLIGRCYLAIQIANRLVSLGFLFSSVCFCRVPT
jgi:hypothetical protein